MAEREVSDAPDWRSASDPQAAHARAMAESVPERREIGQLLLDGLERLSIIPDVLAWVNTEDYAVLALITSLVDRVEAIAVYDLLFTAQDRGVIDERVPLMEVSLYSPRSELGLDLMNNLRLIQSTGKIEVPQFGRAQVERSSFVVAGPDPAVVVGSEIIAVRSTGYSAIQDLRRFERAHTILAKAA